MADNSGALFAARKIEFNLINSAFLYAYCIFVGVCYQLGFWSSLHFDIIPFLSPIDFLKIAAYPIMAGILTYIFTAMMSTYIIRNGDREVREKSGNKFLKWYYIIYILLNAVLVAIAFIILLYNFYISDLDNKLRFGLPILSIIAVFYFADGSRIEILEDKIANGMIVGFFCILPTAAYGLGDRKINDIISNERSYYYLGENSSNCKTDSLFRNIYLGKYGDHFIFYNNIFGDICIENNGNIKLKHYQYVKN